MNELLGWYGYDKVELRDSEANEMRNYRERRQHVSVLKGKGPRVEGPPPGRLFMKQSRFHRFPRRCSTLDNLLLKRLRFHSVRCISRFSAHLQQTSVEGTVVRPVVCV